VLRKPSPKSDCMPIEPTKKPRKKPTIGSAMKKTRRPANVTSAPNATRMIPRKMSI
jgi:hypothetical protein